MIYSYTETGVSANQGGTISAIVDTESPAFKNRIAWIRQQATILAQPEELYEVVQSPGDPTPNTTGSLIWRTAEAALATDVYLTMLSPEVTLAALDAHFRLGIKNLEHLRYADPAPAAPVEDWKVPGAAIGPPHPTYAGHFATAHQGQPVGFIWTAPSGNRYQHVMVGNGMFAWPLWRKL